MFSHTKESVVKLVMSELWVTPDELAEPTRVESIEAANIASSILYTLTGRKYHGIKRTTEIYECEGQGSICCGGGAALSYFGIGVQRSHGGFVNNQIRLRGTPIKRIIAVRVGLERRLINPTEYRVLDRKYLRPTIGATWSVCSPELEITYEYGVEPPAMGKRAARLLANELSKSMCGEDCSLPSNVTNITRQDISLSILDPQDFLEDGRTGIYEVDLFLKSSNPQKAMMKARVFLPDAIRGYSITTVNTEQIGTEFDIVLTRGLSYSKTLNYLVSGVPQPISGVWDVQALVRNSSQEVVIDLDPYITIEDAAETGRIDIDIPESFTSSLGNLTGTWALILRNIANPETVIKIFGGDVWVQDI